MKDPTKAMRTMYVQGLKDIIRLYDGIAPVDTSSLFGVVLSTNFNREPLKSVNTCKFSVTVAIYQEFLNDGNSEGVDDVANSIIEIMVPLERSGYLVVTGFSQNEITLEGGSNQAFQNDALVVFQKTITINHFLSEN